MPARLNTRERIIHASLELFNAQGERSVTTNHIAAHLGISPGNLYYHFRNKQVIVAELFSAYETWVDGFLRLPADRALRLEDKAPYLESLLQAVWRYRFLHRDLEHLLEADPELAARYRRFAARCLARAKHIYQGFVDAGILRMTPPQVEALALNAWIITTSWVRFLCSTGESTVTIDETLLRRGIYQLLTLEDGYVVEDARPALMMLYERLYVPLNIPSDE
ncbi:MULTISPECIES: TetR/AcrR family transcriptional regulator [Pseudomonas]|jgi:AcrR family transcriptional regulator|uniref:TetR/AcrR family transcriptional regulator n=1 Tax=Serpens gallinarum TaxID=2763075 RepID=A0ABR8TNV8_9PSED|nr:MULTISPECIES: TetR/AcrR family transcriptional regulator [Pseudomonas]MBD7976979.1 TetR/AcrR family transcriptional regulator [Serpens gallinarum]MBF0674382.1 TetR/AcrR family transcriptional regulator [Pseudomonas sp.]